MKETTVVLDVNAKGDITISSNRDSLPIKDVEQLVNKVAQDFALNEFNPHVKELFVNLLKRNRRLYWLNVLFFGIILFLLVLLWR